MKTSTPTKKSWWANGLEQSARKSIQVQFILLLFNESGNTQNVLLMGLVSNRIYRSPLRCVSQPALSPDWQRLALGGLVGFSNIPKSHSSPSPIFYKPTIYLSTRISIFYGSYAHHKDGARWFHLPGERRCIPCCNSQWWVPFSWQARAQSLSLDSLAMTQLTSRDGKWTNLLFEWSLTLSIS